jgi:hypothetical protein
MATRSRMASIFKVTASDREANPPATARGGAGERTGVDRQHAAIDYSCCIAPHRAGVEVEFTAADAASPLRRCEYSLDAGNWTPVEAGDGVIDSRRKIRPASG